MSDKISRRKLITAGLGATAGVAGLGVAARLAAKYGLVPPDCGGLYGPGATLNYAAHRLFTRNALAREFPRDRISKAPFANGSPPTLEAFKRSQAGGFADWRLTVDGLVSRPRAFSVAELKQLPARSQITQVTCEEGWCYIAEWIGTPLSQVLELAGVLPQARFVVYYSIERQDWWDSIDIDEAVHPQTLVAHGFNGGELPVGFGGPLRMRVPRQLAYKSIKYLTHLTVTDNLRAFGNGAPDSGYSWYAGI